MANLNSTNRTNINAVGGLRIPISTQIKDPLIRDLTNHPIGFVVILHRKQLSKSEHMKWINHSD
jgi:hypothetical protein